MPRGNAGGSGHRTQLLDNGGGPDLYGTSSAPLTRRARYEQEVMFRQRHQPGHLGLSDFTAAKQLGVLIAVDPLTR